MNHSFSFVIGKQCGTFIRKRVSKRRCKQQCFKVPVVENKPEEHNLQHFPARRVPARLVVPCNKFELNILHEIIKNGKTSNQIMYIDYVNECNRKGIPDRTFNAFRATLLRAKKSKE